MVLNKKYRLPLAFGLALFIHFMMMNIAITKGPVVMPDFHVPLSVNVFLGQTYEPQGITDIQEMKEPAVEQVKAEPVQQNSTEEKVPQVQDKVVTEEPKSPVMPIDTKHEPIAYEPDTSKIEKTLLEKSTATVTPDSSIKTDAKETGISKNEVETGQSEIGAVRLARPMYRVNNPPVYPKLARKRGYEGTVILQVLVNEQGEVDDLRIETSCDHAMLDRAAFNAVRKWLFEPGRKGTEKIGMWVKVPVTFKLN
jgi:protein TonB